jgi:dihydrofolate reductase
MKGSIMFIVILAVISVDGFIAHDTLDSVSWGSKEDKRLFRDITKEIGTVIMGRTTYDTLPAPLKGRKLVVMTRDKELTNNHSDKVTFTHLGPVELVNMLSEENITKVVVAGGASVYRQFLETGLVNEIYLTIEPILLGSGIRLFDKDIPTQKLSLISSFPLTSDVLHLRYAIEKDPL